ncbi:MAG TPA: hypothetical protein P5346_11300 [Spirochaetota bacterium]|nr:hypothetical protein [Spirochaetota bacterium]
MDTIKLKKLAPLLALAAIPLLIVLALLISPSYSVLVLDADSHYYRARVLFMFRNHMACKKDEALFQSRDIALAHQMKDSGIALVSLADIKLLEILPEELYGESESDEADLPVSHYGRFKINASGHIGYLYLSAGEKGVYGTIRFPDWGLGAYEKLKDIRIGKDTVSFTRSVTTPQEMRKTGAPVYFTQKYQGKYLLGGKIIKGQYRTAQGKFLWEAQRVK